MMQLILNPKQAIWLGDGSPENTLHTAQLPLNGRDAYTKHYSYQLRRLVNDCLKYRAADRPSAWKFLERIFRNTKESNDPEQLGNVQPNGTPWPDLSHGMRSGMAGRGAGVRARQYMVPVEPDTYQLLMARDRLPPQMDGK